jgi:hypothetical protein
VVQLLMVIGQLSLVIRHWSLVFCK